MTADLDIGTKRFNLEATQGEHPWNCIVPLIDKAKTPVILTNAIMSIEFRRSGNTGAADYVGQLMPGNEYDVEYAASDLYVSLDDTMPPGTYNNLTKVALSNGDRFVLQGIFQVQKGG